MPRAPAPLAPAPLAPPPLAPPPAVAVRALALAAGPLPFLSAAARTRTSAGKCEFVGARAPKYVFGGVYFAFFNANNTAKHSPNFLYL